MTQEDKELLLKDLCARLPYKPLVHIHNLDVIDYDNYLYADYLDKMMSYSITLKPYLRPMSSMTKKEREEFYHNRTFHDGRMFESEGADVDWLNSYHFDYRGLIEKGLALEALEGMYNIKEE